MKIAYYIIKSLLSLMMVGSATMYLVSRPDVVIEFNNLGFPEWIITPLAIAKYLGVVAIWGLLKIEGADRLRDFAYAGFFFNFALAAGGHWHAGDGEFGAPLMAMALLIATAVLRSKLRVKN